MRTTLDIDTPILDDLKAFQKQRGGSLGEIVSELLADALKRRKEKRKTNALHWVSKEMRARVDLEDHDALERALEENA